MMMHNRELSRAVVPPVKFFYGLPAVFRSAIIDGFQCGAIFKCPKPYFCYCRWYVKGGKSRTAIKRIVGYLGSADGNSYLRKARAIFKDIHTHFLDTVGKYYGGKGGAILKGIRTNIRNAVWYSNACKIYAIFK